MRILLPSLATALLLTMSVDVFAQSGQPPVYDETSPFIKDRATSKSSPRSLVRTLPESTTARLIHERALQQARQRRARIETRRWAGYSLLRPEYTHNPPALTGWNLDAPGFSTGEAAAPRYHFLWHGN